MNRETISANQIMSIVASSLIGVSILALPSSVARVAGPDGWISFLLAWAGSMAALYLVVALARRFPGESLLQYSIHILGRPAGTAATFLFGVVELVSSALVTRVFSEAVVSAVLPEAPHEVICAAMTALVAYLSLQRVRVFARVHELFLVPILVTFGLFILSVYQNAYLANITPVLARGAGPVLAGVARTSLAFQGFEIMLLFFAYAANPGEIARSSLLGLSLAGVLYVTAIAGVTAVFGPEHLKSLQWPMLEAIRIVGASPGVGFERIESLFMTVWMIAAFTSAGALGYAGIRALSDAIGWQDATLSVPVFSPVLYAISLAPSNLFSVLDASSLSGQVAIVYTVLLTITLLGVAVIRRRRGDSGARTR
ncbi:MAG: GerAB/ArcD/ProY family transporter [Firmicutes bacterium]|nr:GerAB/ArcD/ProY family transporter [Bacillota bacterium]